MTATDPSTVIVAPRELFDLVYRATRLTGAGHGVSTEIARAASFAHVQLDSQLANVLGALRRGRTPVWGRPIVAATGGLVEWPAGPQATVVVADLALFAWEAGERGSPIVLQDHDGIEFGPGDWLRADVVDRPISGPTAHQPPGTSHAADLRRRVGERSAAAAGCGVPIDAGRWHDLVTLARGYLVPEADLDRQD